MTRRLVERDLARYNEIEAEPRGRLQELCSCARVRVQVQPDVVTFSAAISACESSRQWEVALSLFTTLREWQSQLDTITYGSIISACEKGKAWEEALLLFQYMLEDGIPLKPLVYHNFPYQNMLF